MAIRIKYVYNNKLLLFIIYYSMCVVYCVCTHILCILSKIIVMIFVLLHHIAS